MNDQADAASQDALTPAERRRARVRDAILEAAERVFAAEGEAGLSIRRLADEINYSPAAIYKYFDSKSALVEELKQAFFERFLRRMEKVLNSQKPFIDCAREGLAAYVQTAIERPHHYVAAFSGEAPAELSPGATPERAVAFRTSPAGQAFALLRDMVEEGIGRGEFHAGLDATLAAKSVWSSCHGLAMLIAHLPCFPRMSAEPDEMDRETFVDFHAAMLVAGLQHGMPGTGFATK